MVLTYRYRVKSLTGLLNQQADSVNFVWNFCNDRQKDALRYCRSWLTGFDLNNLTSGSCKELGLSSGTVNAVAEQFAKSRIQKKRPFLRYRGRKSLGWVPIKAWSLKRQGDAFRFFGKTFRVFNSRPLPDGKIKDGSNFCRDRRGNWFLNVVVEVDGIEPKTRPISSGVGIDLGLKSFATFSTGEVIDPIRLYRDAQPALATAHKAHKKKRIKSIHAKTANRRADFQHKLSSRLVLEFDYIAVGDVNASSLVKTKMAKSVLDSAWSSFRKQLAYKAIKHGAWVEEVDERLSTQTCSDCGSLPDSRPRGIAGLGIRNWICSECGCVHDRDVNAAKNILRGSNFRAGHGTPVVGISTL